MLRRRSLELATGLNTRLELVSITIIPCLPNDFDPSFPKDRRYSTDMRPYLHLSKNIPPNPIEPCYRPSQLASRA